MDVPISSYDPDGAKKAAEFLNSLRGYKEMKSQPRATIPSGYEISYILGTHDGSSQGFGGNLYCISKRKSSNKIDKEEYVCRMILARGAVHENTSHKNEIKRVFMR